MKIFENEVRIKNISNAVLVKSDTGIPIHKNRPFHGLSYTVSGSKVYCFDDGTTVKTGANEIVYLPKYSNYTVKIFEHGDCYAINFDIDTNEIFEPQNWHFNNISILTDIFDTSAKLWLSEPNDYSYKLHSLLYELLYLIKKEQTNQTHNKDYLRIKSAIEYIDCNYTDSQTSIAVLANMCNISDTYFRKLFYSLYKTTPLKYINFKRMELAKHLLESNIYNISEVQKLCGFSDPSVFSRTFKAYYNCSPSAYNRW